MDKKAVVFIILALIIGLAGGAYAGYYYGKTQGTKNLRDVVNLVFPEPPKEVFAVSGVLKQAVGAQLTLETADFDDYLPHADGTPSKKITRQVFLSNATKITMLHPASIDSKGNMKQETISATDLKEGMMVTIRSKENIRDAKSIEASEVEVVQY